LSALLFREHSADCSLEHRMAASKDPGWVHEDLLQP
jgi:hypothetical protein